MPDNDSVKPAIKEGVAKQGGTKPHQPPKVPLLGISKIPRGEDLDHIEGSSSGSGTGSGSGSGKRKGHHHHHHQHQQQQQHHENEESSQNGASVPFNEETFQSITPRTLSLLTPRSAAAYNAAAFSSFKGGSNSSFSPFYGTASMQHYFKSFGKLMHYAAKAQDVEDLIKHTELSVDRLRFSSVSFSSAWRLGRMSSAAYSIGPYCSTKEDSSEREVTFRDTVLAWKFYGSEDRPENISCKSMDMHQCAEESFCAECTYLFAVFVATFYAPKTQNQNQPARQQRSTSADSIDSERPFLPRIESEGEEDKMPLPERPSGTASTPGRKPHHHFHHHTDSSGSSSSADECFIREEKVLGQRRNSGSGSQIAQSSSPSTSFSEPTVIRMDWEEDDDQDDVDADREIADTLSSPPMRTSTQKLQQAFRPVVPPPEDRGSGRCSSGEGTLCAERFFDTTMTPRGISSAFATLPRVKDDDVMHVNSAMLHHLGGSASALLGDSKEIGIGQVCINLHIWNGDKSNSFIRAAAFSKALRLDRAWALPSAARAASLLVFSNAVVDTGAVATPRGEHIVSKPIGDSESTLGTGPKEYSMSSLIRSKLLKTYRTLAASFSPGFLQMLAGNAPRRSLFEENLRRGSESERKVLKVRLDSGGGFSPTPGGDTAVSPFNRCFRRREGDRDSGNAGDSDSDNEVTTHVCEFKVPYDVVRPPATRERTGSNVGLNQSSSTPFHLDQRQTVSDDEYSDDNKTKRHGKREITVEFVKSSPKVTVLHLPSPNSSGAKSPGSGRVSPGGGRASPGGGRKSPGFGKPPSPNSNRVGPLLTIASPIIGKTSPLLSVTSPSASKTSPVVSLASPVSGKTSPSTETPSPVSGKPHLVVSVDPQIFEKPASPGSSKSGGSSAEVSPSSDSDPKLKKSLSLKNSGKSVSTTALTPKKPIIPMLALGGVSDARRCNSQAQLTTAYRNTSRSASDNSSPKRLSRSHKAASAKNVMVHSVPKLPLSAFPRACDPEPEPEPSRHRSHSGDPSQEVRGRDYTLMGGDEDDGIDESNLESENDRNGGEVSGGMRKYRGVLSKIDDQLYLTGEGGAQDLAALQEACVARVLNVADAVCHEYHPGQFKYLSIDLQDNGAKEDLRPLFLPTIDFIEKGRTVLHCQQGVSRSATFVIAYIMWKNNLTFRHALDYVMKRRPVISPNGGFMGQLLLWEVVLQNSREALKSAPPRLLRMMSHVGSRHEVLMVAKDVANVCRASLDSRTCFLLHNPATRTVYMWIGSNCAPPLLAGAANVCEMMKKYLWVETVVEERQDFESDAFWRALRDNRGTVGIVDEFNRDYATRLPGFIYRYSAFDPVELRCVNINMLREQTKRQAWVYYPDENSPLVVSVPDDFVMRLNGREITDGNEIATIVCRLFCLAAHIPETTSFKYIKDGRELLDAWLGTNPSQDSTFKIVPAPRKDV